MRSPCRICGDPVHGQGLCKKHHLRLLRHGDPLAGGPEHGVNRSTFEGLATVETDRCILWPLTLKDGYGRMDVDGKAVRVHRLACELRHGSPEGQADAAHSCGDRACMNYRHLRWATRAENEADKVSHGRTNQGRGGSSLAAEDVLEIRRRSDAGERQRDIAEDYRISRTTVSYIARRVTWAWLPEAEAALLAMYGRERGEG